MKKLQNSFNTFLPQKYGAFTRGMNDLTGNQAVVAELLRICCEEENPKAIQMALERIIGKPEHLIVIKRTKVRTIYVDATHKATVPVIEDRIMDEVGQIEPVEEQIVVTEANAPGILVKKTMDKIGEENRSYAYEVIDDKDQYQVAEVMAANLYSMAMTGGNLKAIDLIFNYLDGAVADVIKLEGEDTVVIESYADVAPYEAIQDENGVWYLDTQAVS